MNTGKRRDQSVNPGCMECWGFTHHEEHCSYWEWEDSEESKVANLISAPLDPYPWRGPDVAFRTPLRVPWCDIFSPRPGYEQDKSKYL